MLGPDLQNQTTSVEKQQVKLRSKENQERGETMRSVRLQRVPNTIGEASSKPHREILSLSLPMEQWLANQKFLRTQKNKNKI